LRSPEVNNQSANYGPAFDPDFIDYQKRHSVDERHAFDMAMGYVFGKISDLHLQLPSSGLYLLVKASNVAPEPFYNAHRDRSDRSALLSTADNVPAELDRYSRAVFGNGWYPANHLPPVARWMTARSWLSFKAERLSRIHLQLTTHIPDLRTSPMELEFKLNGERICSLCLFEYDWLELEIDVPETTTRETSSFRLDINASRAWQPSAANPNSGDDRYLSIAVCKLRIS
jgi:hypothetical protein